MTHELRTPLNAILGFSELMASRAESLTPAQIRDYAGLVNQGGSNLLKIINQIMDLTKIAAGRYELRRTAVDAGALMWRALDIFQSRAAAHGLVIDASSCPIGLMADADETVLAAMVHSLIDNALTFCSGSRVTFSVKADEAGIALTVADDGAGVAPEDLARIQEPFEHASSEEARQHSKGAGLGLTLVRALAELHGGWLELESLPQEGFRATILLPAVP
jgi:signal transduction histidine kinase